MTTPLQDIAGYLRGEAKLVTEVYTPTRLRSWADRLDAAAKELAGPNMAGWPEEAVWTVRFLRGTIESRNKHIDEQAAEIERLRHHHCSNCGRRSEFISRGDPCLTKKLAGMERLIERLRADNTDMSAVTYATEEFLSSRINREQLQAVVTGWINPKNTP